jgi:microcystin-dependent protein
MKPIAKLTRFLSALALPALLAFNSQFSTSFAQGTTAFTYQGRLNVATNRANGFYDMTFAVYDANVAGNLIAGPITNSGVAVSNGLFTVTLDFGPGVFTGTNYWVGMAVSPAGAGTFATLVPRQQLTPTPYALSLVAPQSTALCPPGSVMAYMGTNAPPGWLLCDGSLYSRTNYAALFAVIGTASGAGDGSTTFNVPDMRGIFLRGVDTGAGNDPDTGSRITQRPGGNVGDAVGSYQADMFAAHEHSPSTYGINQSIGLNGPFGNTVYVSAFAGSGVSVNNAPTTGSAGGDETRPKNVYVNYIIKY